MPLETPTLLDDEVSSQVYRAANKRTESGEAAHDLAAWGREMDGYAREGVNVASPERSEQFNLESDEVLNTNLWTQEELEAPVRAIERIEEAKPPESRAQQVEMMLHSCDNAALLKRFDEITKAIGGLHHLV